MSPNIDLLRTRHVLPVLDYIVANPGCIQERVRRSVLANGGTLRDVLDRLIAAGIVKEVLRRRTWGRKTLTVHLYATKEGVTIAYLYRLMRMAESGDLDPRDPNLAALMEANFGKFYMENVDFSEEEHFSNA